ncbi:MAG: DNA polymerase III subunit delta [Methylocystis sp.]|jgi:DNA polymerase-3 subunit delta
MVAVKKGDAERFVDAPPEHVFLFLVHGSDAGLVRERALRLAARRVDDRHDPFQFVEMSGDAIAADPLALLDEANTIPLFGGRRALLVETGAKAVAPAVEMLLAAPPRDCSVILTAGALRKDAPLRKLVEGSKNGAGLECSPDSDADVNALIDRTLREADLAASPEARALLQAALGEDRLMSRSELQKLALFMHGRTRVEAADVMEIVAHASNIAADVVILEAFGGRMQAAGADFDDTLAQGGDATLLISNALRYALSLHRGRVGGGVMAVKRGGFFSVPDGVIEAHLKLWPAPRLAAMVETLRAAQSRARAHADMARVEAARALMNIASGAGRS